MTREEGSEFRNSIIISWLQTPQESVVQVAGVRRPNAVTTCDNTRIDTSRIAMPNLDNSIGNWLTSNDVHNLGVENELNTLLRVSYIFSNIFAPDIVRTLSHLWGEDTGAVGSEQSAVRGI